MQVTPLQVGARALVPYDAQLRQDLRFTTTDGEVVDLAEMHGDGEFMWVPRAKVPFGGTDFRSHGQPFVHSIARPPRSQEQGEIITKSAKLLHGGVDHIINAPTGWGKTYAGCAVACQLGRTTLIVLPKSDLFKSWRDTLINLMGIPPERIGRIQQDECDWQDKWFVLGMLHSLVIPDRYDDQPGLIPYFGMVVFDEVHRLGAEGFSRICHMFPAKYRLGFSATPIRWDGKQRIFEAHIGPVLLRGKTVPMSPKVLVKPTGWRIPKGWVKNDDGSWRKVSVTVTPGKMAPVTKKAAASQARNAIIVDFVATAFKTGRRTVIMSDLIEGHLKPLFHLLAAAGVPGEAMDYYISGRTALQLEAAKQKAVVLATYQMCDMGTDVPEWDTLVLATPRANVKQAIGRVMRSMEGKRQPVVLDLLDADDVYQGFYGKREQQYYEVGAQIVRMAA